jgi:hypothetical protein
MRTAAGIVIAVLLLAGCSGSSHADSSAAKQAACGKVRHSVHFYLPPRTRSRAPIVGYPSPERRLAFAIRADMVGLSPTDPVRQAGYKLADAYWQLRSVGASRVAFDQACGPQT